MRCTGDDEDLLVVPRDGIVNVLAVPAGIRLFSDDKKRGLGKQGRAGIDCGKKHLLVAADEKHPVDGAWVRAAGRAVVFPCLDKRLGECGPGVFGFFEVAQGRIGKGRRIHAIDAVRGYGVVQPFRSSGLPCPLSCHGFNLFYLRLPAGPACPAIPIRGAYIRCADPGSRLYAPFSRCHTHDVATAGTEPQRADLLLVDKGQRRQVIHRAMDILHAGERILGIAGLSAAFAYIRGIESQRDETFLRQSGSVKPGGLLLDGARWMYAYDRRVFFRPVKIRWQIKVAHKLDRPVMEDDSFPVFRADRRKGQCQRHRKHHGQNADLSGVHRCLSLCFLRSATTALRMAASSPIDKSRKHLFLTAHVRERTTPAPPKVFPKKQIIQMCYGADMGRKKVSSDMRVQRTLDSIQAAFRVLVENNAYSS